MKTDPPTPANRERRIKPISRQEKELTEALDFLVDHKTDAAQMKRCEEILKRLFQS